MMNYERWTKKPRKKGYEQTSGFRLPCPERGPVIEIFPDAAGSFWGYIIRACTPARNCRSYQASRCSGGIHFELGDLVARATGRQVADQAWIKAQAYIHGDGDGDDVEGARETKD
jgi:hypothetical protein